MFTTESRKLLVVAAAVLIAVPQSVWAGGAYVSAKQAQEEATQEEKILRTGREKLGKAARLKDRFMVQVQQANDMLAKLAAANDTFTKQMTDLLTSDDGKRLVRDPISFTTYLQMHDHPCVIADDIKIRQKAAASIADGLKAEAKEIDVGWLPSPDTLEEAIEIYLWARDRGAQLEGQQAAIKTMLEKAAKVDDPSKAPTLAKAIEQYRAKQLQDIAELKLIGEAKGEKEAKQIVIDAAYAARLEQAQQDALKIQEQKRTELAQMKAVYEERLLQAQAAAERKLVEAQESFKNERAALVRLSKDAATSRAAEDTNSNIKRKAVEDAMKKKEQIALINSREVQELLAPFIAKGYWQPLGSSYDPEPISLSQLARCGALTPSAGGVQMLMRIAADRHDQDRPRWPYGGFIDHLSSEQRAKVTQAQKYLNMYGNLMVQQGMLSN